MNNIRIFVELDGILCDFEKQFKKHSDGITWDELVRKIYQVHIQIMTNLMKNESKDKIQRLARDNTFSSIWIAKCRTKGFFSHMPLTKDFKRLWKFLKMYQTIVITALPVYPELREPILYGRRKWIDRYMGARIPLAANYYDWDNPAHSTRHMFCESPDDLLISNRQKNVDEWTSRGGVAILYTSLEDVLDKLQFILTERGELCTSRFGGHWRNLIQTIGILTRNGEQNNVVSLIQQRHINFFQEYLKKATDEGRVTYHNSRNQP